ncbi:hypothetical protein KUF71_019923 [Frankliniella fusca]|uniref:Uncharacterized protein n=1 Tax=Frankliniella fusca TaxID=407009 RepID=A0AAE1GVU1_9NEOP|nr:hypothetical protein KUF71_019923 [Frankliniella fusca]
MTKERARLYYGRVPAALRRALCALLERRRRRGGDTSASSGKTVFAACVASSRIVLAGVLTVGPQRLARRPAAPPVSE